VNAKKQAGFTLTELIIVIVLIGIISASIGPLIGNKFSAVAQSTERAKWVQQAEFAMFHIRQDLAHSVPNSICNTAVSCNTPDQTIEFLGINFVNSDQAARYRDKQRNGFDRLNPNNNGCQNKDFDGNGSDDYNSCFDLFGFFINLPANLSVNLQNPSEIRSATPSSTTTAILDSVTSFTNPPANTTPITKVAISDTHNFSGHSPYFRTYFYDGPIAYECDVGNSALYRVSSYNSLVSATPFATRTAAANRDRVITDLISCEFELIAGTVYLPPSLRVSVEIGEGNESIQLIDTILLSNGS